MDVEFEAKLGNIAHLESREVTLLYCEGEGERGKKERREGGNQREEEAGKKEGERRKEEKKEGEWKKRAGLHLLLLGHSSNFKSIKKNFSSEVSNLPETNRVALESWGESTQRA